MKTSPMIQNNDYCENEKAFAFYAYTLSFISTGISPQKATERAREKFNPAVITTIRSIVGEEKEYSEMCQSTNPVPFWGFRKN